MTTVLLAIFASFIVGAIIGGVAVLCRLASLFEQGR